MTYNDFHQVTKSEQAHDGAVGVGTPAVDYAYDLSEQTGNIWSDNARLEKITYPDGRVIVYTYGSQGTLNDRIDRPFEIRLTSVTGTVLGQYEYQASGRLAEVDLGISGFQPDLRSNYYNADSDDEYEAYDRFGNKKSCVPFSWRSGPRTGGGRACGAGGRKTLTPPVCSMPGRFRSPAAGCGR